MKDLFLRNLGLKLLAAALAVLLWFALSGERRRRVSERAFVISLTVVNLPSDLVIASPIPDSVDVRLRGPFSAMRQADSSKMEAVMDLSGSRNGDTVYKLTSDDINAPAELEVVSLNPSTVRLRIEPFASRTVPIRVQLEPRDPRSSWNVSPATATISGPQSQVERIQSIQTEPVVVPGDAAEFSTSVVLTSEPGIRIVLPRGPVAVHVRRRPAP